MRPEANLLDYNGDAEIFTFWKGRVALYAILKALDIGPGDAVFIPGYTCQVVPSAVIFLGARPVYADVEEKSYNLSLETLEAAWQKINGIRPKAIIIQHTYGIPVDAGPIIEWARSEGLSIIEDCAHVLGSSYRGIPCGHLGDAAFFSSQWNKPISTGLGGWAVVNSPLLGQRMRQVAADFAKPSVGETAILALQYYVFQLLFRPQLYWPLMDFYRFLTEKKLAIGSSSVEELAVDMPQRYALGMSSFQENLLRLRFARAATNIAHRQRLTNYYTEILKGAGIEPPQMPQDSQAVMARYPVRVQNKAQMLALARERRLELGDWFVSPVHNLLDHWDKLGYRAGSCPVGEELCRTVVNLPTHSGVTQKEAERISSLVMNGRADFGLEAASLLQPQPCNLDWRV
jgi:dTDP-4-amino-4,6-dideoxygalactose transaminase